MAKGTWVPVFHYCPGMHTEANRRNMHLAPFCTPHLPFICKGGGHLATDKREEVTCKRCLAKMNKAPTAPKATRVRKVEILVTNRLNGQTCIMGNQGDIDLFFHVVPTDQAKALLADLCEQYPGAKVEVR